MNRINQGGETGRSTSWLEEKQEQRPGGETVAQVGSEQQSSSGGRCRCDRRGWQSPLRPPKHGLWPEAKGSHGRTRCVLERGTQGLLWAESGTENQRPGSREEA